jgi:tetratricopeptide (TPR) repeat protein
MLNERSRSDYGAQAHRKRTVHKALVAGLLVFFLIAAVFVVGMGLKNRSSIDRKELRRLYDAGSYEEAFEMSQTGLEQYPMDYFLLSLHGFASYQLAIAQINTFDTLIYVDECIWSLRKALLTKDDSRDGRVQYVLGKAYYSKGSGYVDLAIRFLEEARDLSYNAEDIPEFLGLAYAAAQDYRSSVAAFSIALNPAAQGSEGGEQAHTSDYPSALLLLALARSYIALDETETATAYLIRCIDSSQDSNIITAARLLLGDIFFQSGRVEEAEALYLSILENDAENAEAHFQLGELYAAKVDITRARAEWRRAVRIDPSHGKARARLNM